MRPFLAVPALPMKGLRAMKALPVTHLFRSALFAASLLVVGPSALAQTRTTAPPIISRMCLWNADKATWKELGLKRDHIRRMAELRARYPAVIDGQWDSRSDGDESMSLDEAASSHNAMPEAATMLSKLAERGRHGGHSPGGSNAPMKGLQAELREVLSVEQMRAWRRLCHGDEE